MNLEGPSEGFGEDGCSVVLSLPESPHKNRQRVRHGHSQHNWREKREATWHVTHGGQKNPEPIGIHWKCRGQPRTAAIPSWELAYPSLGTYGGPWARAAWQLEILRNV